MALNDKRLRESLDKIKLNKLTSFFSGKCSALQTHKCPYCFVEFATKAKRGGHMWRCKKNPDYNKANSEKKLPKKTNKKLSSNEEQIMEKLQQQISINTEKCMESDSE